MTDLFVTQTKPDLTLNKTINQGNNILHTPSLQHLYSRYLASDEDERFPYNTLYNLLHLEINCDSPKTKQAMNNLEIKIDDLAIQNYDNFIIKHEAAEITYFRYQSHLQNIACARKNLIKERNRIKKWENKSFLSSFCHSEVDKKKGDNNSMLHSLDFLKLDTKFSKAKLQKKTEKEKKRLEKEALILMEKEIKLLKINDEKSNKNIKILQTRENKIEEKKKIAIKQNTETFERVKNHKKKEKEKENELYLKKKEIFNKENEKQVEIAKLKQKQIKLQIDKLINEEYKQQEILSKRAQRLKFEEMETEELIKKREIKDYKTKRHFQLEKERKKKIINENIEIFKEKLDQIHDLKEKQDKEIIQNIVGKYQKTHESIQKHYKDIENKQKKQQDLESKKYEKIKENIKNTKRELRENTQNIIEKKEEKFKKVEEIKYEKEDLNYQKSEQFRWKMNKILEKHMLNNLENKKRADEIVEKNLKIKEKIKKIKEKQKVFQLKAIENSLQNKIRQEYLLKTVSNIQNLQESKKIIRKLKKMNLSVDNLEKYFTPIPQKTVEEDQQIAK